MRDDSLTYLVPAKINLHLRVGSVAGDGFHPVRSWMATVGLHDRLTGSIVEDAREPITLSVDDHPTLRADPLNLVHRAARAMKFDRPIALRLQKQIPIGAGLGGGSADAAATLLLVNALLGQNRSSAELHGIAATLGSDVPFFLNAPAAIATGRGERLERCPAPSVARHAVLILPPFGVATPAAYRALDAMPRPADAEVLRPFDVSTWAEMPAQQLMCRLMNDLEPPAFVIEPRLARLRSDWADALGRTVRMSGSGSTLFTLYDDATDARAASDLVRSQQASTGCGAVAVPLGIDVIRAIDPASDAFETLREFSD